MYILHPSQQLIDKLGEKHVKENQHFQYCIYCIFSSSS